MFKIANRVWLNIVGPSEMCYTCMRPKLFCRC